MKKRKLRRYVLPTCYLLILGIMVASVTFLTKNLLTKNITNDDHHNYSMSVFDEKEESTGQEENESNTTLNEEKPIKPFTNETVDISKSFYQVSETAENQEKALIYYENTYMPNTGVLYEADESFEVVAVLDGTVKDIKTDEILGSVLTISHNDKLTTVYYTFGEIKVSVGDNVTKGDVIATSGTTKLQTAKPQTLLFEVYYNGTLMNPLEFYEKNVNDLK